jgi:cytochrome c-type biogenesis protein CcmH
MSLKKLGITLFLFLVFASPVMAEYTTVSDIADQLICQCGCNMVLSNCTHAECGSRKAMTDLIEQKLAQGQSQQEIIQFFVAQYGEQVLASPPKRGFNLIAWALPFVAILGGGGIIYIALKKWVSRGKRRQTIAVTGAEQEPSKYQRQMEKELAEFTGRGFR